MSSFRISGGKQLKGEIIPQGAKNEALQVICACLLTKEKIILHNVPAIRDVIKLIELLKALGVQVSFSGNSTYSFEAIDIDLNYLKTEDFKEKVGALRGSIMILGPLIARFGRGIVYTPGGDKIGRRRLDTHFFGLQKLGAEFDYDYTKQLFNVSAKELKHP